MGSSGAAVVAGCLLANQVCRLGLDRERLMDFALVVEGHPDNVAASMFGGFTAGYMNGALEDSPIDGDNKNDCSMDNMQNGTNGTRASADEELNIPGQDLGVYIPIPWPKAIKAVLVIPTFELATKLARSVLPPHYTRADVVFNLQRLAVLTTSITHYSKTTSPKIIYEAMKDKVHQPYRSHLVPGLTQILELNPDDCPGLLGICMSGAGPCVLAITNKNHQQVGERIQSIWKSTKAPDSEEGIDSEVAVLDVETEGAVVCES